MTNKNYNYSQELEWLSEYIAYWVDSRLRFDEEYGMLPFSFGAWKLLKKGVL